MVCLKMSVCPGISEGISKGIGELLAATLNQIKIKEIKLKMNIVNFSIKKQLYSKLSEKRGQELTY